MNRLHPAGASEQPREALFEAQDAGNRQPLGACAVSTQTCYRAIAAGGPALLHRCGAPDLGRGLEA